FVVEQLEQQREVIVFGLSRQAESLFMRTGLTAELGRDRIVQTRRQALDLATLRSPHYAQHELFAS
ncbi:MAG: hypothetical protein ACRDAM_03860, partial [Casimicrobium sp.]